MLQLLPDTTTVPDLTAYDTILVAFSGGKDSIACVLHLLELGAAPERIELHHHDVDGGWSFMDWPITRAYCIEVAAALGLKIVFSWREGGFLREMTRRDQPTAPVRWETEDGTLRSVGGKGPPGTREMYPQVSSDLSVRWCSPYVKIDVLAAVIRNDPRYAEGKRLLVVTGERAEESKSRANYKPFEPHRTHLTGRKQRHVDQWRPVHRWTRDEVWSIMQRYGIVAHPGYFIGWGRLSCMCCIFGSDDQWASINAIDPRQLGRIAMYESKWGKTIHRTRPVTERVKRGLPYPAIHDDPDMVALATSVQWDGRPVIVPPDQWLRPPGADGEDTGPT